MEIESLKVKIENLLFEYWKEMPKEKPTYTLWFYSEGGPREKNERFTIRDPEQRKERKFCLKSKAMLVTPHDIHNLQKTAGCECHACFLVCEWPLITPPRG
jgi:hypothetical protein